MGLFCCVLKVNYYIALNLKQLEMELTEKEKQSIKTLNFIATYDGVIGDEDDIKYLLNEGINKFISPKRRRLVSITETAYPIKIKY